MTGQTAVEVAKAFGEAVDFDGVALTKLDGDARGGAALSVRAVSGKPILFVGTGEKLEALEPFHPDRMASRILGMGDVMSLIERAQENVTVDDAKKLEAKVRSGSLTLEDFLDQMQQVRKMGPMSQVLGMVPGFRNVAKAKDLQVDDGQLERVEAIIRSMTLHERRNPDVINGSRRRRIAAGSGTSVQEVNQLLSQFKQMRKLMKQMGSGRMPALGGLLGR
jgi:signal recognition particle subunit SRP54